MSVHKWWLRPHAVFGQVPVAMAQLTLLDTARRGHRIFFQVDSGAVVSLLSRSCAELLGLRLEDGQRVELSTVGGRATVAYVHQIQTIFSEQIAYPVRFAISEKEDVPSLLGRLDVIATLQTDLDATLLETAFRAPWLDSGQKRILDFLMETERAIIDRWVESQLPDVVKRSAKRMVDRMSQLFVVTLGLMKVHKTFSGALQIRAMFEMLTQFLYLFDDPMARSEDYLDFEHFAMYRGVQLFREHPDWPTSQQIMNSPLRTEAEPRMKAEYERVRHKFEYVDRNGKNREHENWFRMSIRDLAANTALEDEYLLIYRECCAWAHGDPMTMKHTLHWTTNPGIMFMKCTSFYVQMLKKMVSNGALKLNPEQHGFLNAFQMSWH